MIKIVYIKETKEKGILSLGVSEGEEISRFTLDASFVAESGLAVGEIDDQDLIGIKSRDLYIKGKRKALSLLAFSDNSKKTLMVKLLRFGLDRAMAESIVSEMCDLGYINEDAQLFRMIERLANGQLIGPKKILARLVSKGYSPSDIKRAMREMTDSGEIDFAENKRLLLEKYSVEDGDTELENKILYKSGF